MSWRKNKLQIFFRLMVGYGSIRAKKSSVASLASQEERKEVELYSILPNTQTYSDTAGSDIGFDGSHLQMAIDGVVI